MTKSKSAEPKTASPDYPLLAKTLVEASLSASASKSPSMGLPGGLYIVATPIGNLGDITLRALHTLAQADRILCEDTRSSGLMLAKFGIKRPLLSYNDHNADGRRRGILASLAKGEAIALISDAGMPLIADPGFKLVRDCRTAGHPVTVLPGANAALTALAGSGLPTNEFYFAGFLPPRSVARQKALRDLQNMQATLICYEAPQRLGECLADCAAVFGDAHQAVIARELTKFYEEHKSGTLAELASFYGQNPVKGEIVLLIAPAAAAVPPDADNLDALIVAALNEGLSVRDASVAVSQKTGVKKSDVYARAVRLAAADKS